MTSEVKLSLKLNLPEARLKGVKVPCNSRSIRAARYQHSDLETGLNYYAQCFYEPEIGRCLSRDPAEEEVIGDPERLRQLDLAILND